MDRRILPIPRLLHDNRHLSHRTDTRAPSRWCATMTIVQLDQWKQEEILNPPRKFSQVFDKNTDDRIPSFRRTREWGQDNSMKHCAKNWNRWVKIGGLISRNFLPLHHLYKIGGNKNIKTFNCVNTKTPNGEIINGKITRGDKSEGDEMRHSLRAVTAPVQSQLIKQNKKVTESQQLRHHDTAKF